MRTFAISVVALCAAGFGCVDVADDDEVGSLEAPAITQNRLLLNRDIVGADSASRAEVQALLEHYGSALADYREDGRSAAAWIHQAAVASNISPVYLLARIDTESGLVRSGTLRNLSAATGCACPDSVPCDPRFAGFSMQVQCAAEKMRGYFTSLARDGHTISGWRVGRGKSTLDPCWVVPANRATAALYTYTPWVGAYAGRCGSQRWGGSSLVAVLTRRFQAALAELRTPPPTTGGAIIVDSDDRANDHELARVDLSGSWIHSSATPGYWGSGYAYASVRAVSDPADFWFYLDGDGERTVDARWTAGGNRSQTAPFVIEDADGNRLAVVTRDQQTNGGRWNQLGRFRFTTGWNRVRLSRWTSDGAVVIADAIRIR